MKTIAFIAAGMMMLGLASCDNRPDIAGEWQGTIKDEIPQTAMSNVTVNYSIDRTGAITAAYVFEFSEAVPSDGNIVSPYQISVSGTALVNGVWQYVEREDDEVSISYDIANMQVNIDPDAVLLQENLLIGKQQPQVDSLKASVQQKYLQIIASCLKSTPNVLWEDVKVKKPLLKYEIGKRDYVLHQVNAQ